MSLALPDREDLQDIRNEGRDLRKRIDYVSAEAARERNGLREQIASTSSEIRKQIEATNSRLDSHFRMMMVTMVAMASLIVGVIKL